MTKDEKYIDVTSMFREYEAVNHWVFASYLPLPNWFSNILAYLLTKKIQRKIYRYNKLKNMVRYD